MKPLHAEQTPFPRNVPLSKPIPKLDEETRKALGVSAIMLVDINMGNRWALDHQLDISNAILEMRSQPAKIPWEGAAHIVKPTVFTAYHEFVSRTIGACLVPRPYTVRGNDPISSQYANTSEQFYNAEWDENDCFESYESCIRLGARDGTSVMEVLYDLSTHEELLETEEPVLDDQGQPLQAPDGQPIMSRERKLATFIDYDAPREIEVDLKSFILLPNFVGGHDPINKADGVARKLWMNEHELLAKVNAEIFDAAAVERVLAGFTNTGMGEQAMDPQGNSQYSIANRLSVVDSSVAPPAGMKMARGPLEVFRIHTNLYDLNRDGVPEENVLWCHYASRECFAAVPYDYFGGRPFLDLTMIPRPGVWYGFGVPEIGRAIQEECDTQTNSRLQILDLASKPPRRRTATVRYRKDGGDVQKWDPDCEIEMQNPNDFGFVEVPRVPPESFQEDEKLTQLLDRAVGAPQAGAAGMPVGGNQQRSARAASIEQQLRSMQANLVNTRVRRWMLRIFKFKHGLYQRYGRDQIETVQQTQSGPRKLVVPKEILGLDYTLGITGLGGSIDKDGRREAIGMMTQILLSTPLSALFQGHLSRLWQLARVNIEALEFSDVTTFIGSLDEAIQQEQQMAQNAEATAQMQALLQVLSHGASPPSGGGGKPPLQAIPGGRA